MSNTYPHTIHNGGGEELTFVRYIENNDGGIMEIENKVFPGAGPPMHVHHLQDENLTVLQGKIGSQIHGQPPTFHGPGETVSFSRGIAHRFWNAGDEILICRGQVSPVNNIQYFLTEIFKSTSENGGKRPKVFDGAFLQTKYKSEFDLVEIPKFVKAILFPFVIRLGKIAGKHRKYANAPRPVSR